MHLSFSTYSSNSLRNDHIFSSSGFTLLAFDLPGSAPQDLQPNPVQSIMQCFGWDDMLHPLLVTRYLPHLLQNRYIYLVGYAPCGCTWITKYLYLMTSDGKTSGQSDRYDLLLCSCQLHRTAHHLTTVPFTSPVGKYIINKLDCECPW